MFPGPGAEIIYNEAGEVLGWDYPSSAEPEYCDMCGGRHSADVRCPYPEDEEDEEDPSATYDSNVDYGALLKERLGDDFQITPTGFTLGAPTKRKDEAVVMDGNGNTIGRYTYDA